MAIQAPARALVWSTDLKLGHLPAVCVKTGQPADASVRFRFVTLPTWAYALFLLLLTGVGFFVIFIVMRIVSRVESGRLPYAQAAADRIRLWRWILVATFIGIPVLLVAAIVSLSGDTTIAALVWMALLVDLVATLVIRYAVLNRLGPNGFVHDGTHGSGRWVELRRAHPAFAAALAAMYASRWAASQQPAPMPQLQSAPLPEALAPPAV